MRAPPCPAATVDVLATATPSAKVRARIPVRILICGSFLLEKRKTGATRYRTRARSDGHPFARRVAGMLGLARARPRAYPGSASLSAGRAMGILFQPTSLD